MQTKSLSNTAYGNLVHKALSRLLILSIIAAVTGCSLNVIPPRNDGSTSVSAGKWIGSSDDGTFVMQFNIRSDRASIALFPYSFPCGEQNLYIYGDEPVRIALNDGAFETTIDYSDLTPRLIITGKYTDNTHAEGTWQVSAFQSLFSEMACPAASGTWKGSPE